MNTSAELRPADRAIRTVVVGVDGSAESLAAPTWATRVIEPDGVIHAVAAISPANELAIVTTNTEWSRHV